jgi:hypothetical protein
MLTEAAPERLPMVSSEAELLQKFKAATERRERAKAELDAAETEEDYYMFLIIELCEAKGVTSTAKYAGLGHATVVKPTVTKAFYDESAKEELFKQLRDINRGDIIKETINNTTLRGFVGELVDEIMEKNLSPEEREKKLSVLRMIYYEISPKAKMYAAKKERPRKTDEE